MKCDAQAKALEDRTVRPQPLLSECNGGVEHRGVGFKQGTQRSALMKVDDHVRERLNTPPLRAEDQDSLSIVGQPPGRREAELALIVRKELSSTTLWRHPPRWLGTSEKPRHPWALITDAQVQSRGRRSPNYLAKPEPGWTPVIFDQTAGVIASEPCSKIIKLIAIGQNCRQAHDSPLLRIRTSKKSLDLDFVTNLALIEADHMAFVEDEQANVIEKAWIVAQRKVELLGRCDHDIALPDCVLIEATHPNAAIEGRNRLAEWPEGSL
jgi:hypothetical protein